MNDNNESDPQKRNQFNPEVLPENIGGSSHLRRELSLEDIDSLRDAFRATKAEAGDKWPRVKMEISKKIALKQKRIEEFIKDEGTFYGDSISKLASNFNRVNLEIRKPEEVSSVLNSKYIHFAEVYKKSELPGIKQKIENVFEELRIIKRNIEIIKLENSKTPEERAEGQLKIEKIVHDLIKKFESDSITLVTGILPRFLSPYSDSDASIILVAFFDKNTLMKETHKIVRPGTKPENLKYSFMIKDLNPESYENIKPNFNDVDVPGISVSNIKNDLERVQKLISSIMSNKHTLSLPKLDNQKNEQSSIEKDFTDSQLQLYLNQGFVIAYPTEGVWGLGCNPMDEDAVNRLCKLKERNIDEGLILVSSNQDHLAKFLFGLEYKLIKKAYSKWPGPHTWVIPANPEVPKWIKGKHETVALRWSDHSTIARITSAFGGPICSTSANIRGQKAAKTKQEVKDIFGEKVYFVDGDLGDSQGATSMQNLETDEWLR